MEVNVLDDLLTQLRAVLAQYEQAEREAAQRLQELGQARLMQAGAVRGVEMAIQAMRPDKVSRPDGAGEQA